jgi:predicted RNA-binding protein YlxR (DUF448 family)
VIKARKTPVRTCVGCGTSSDKREFVRIVRTPDGHVEVDPSGKLNGRGAYVCAAPECFTKARLRRRLDHALKVRLHDDDYARLQRDIDGLLAEQSSHQGR